MADRSRNAVAKRDMGHPDLEEKNSLSDLPLK